MISSHATSVTSGWQWWCVGRSTNLVQTETTTQQLLDLWFRWGVVPGWSVQEEEDWSAMITATYMHLNVSATSVKERKAIYRQAEKKKATLTSLSVINMSTRALRLSPCALFTHGLNLTLHRLCTGELAGWSPVNVLFNLFWHLHSHVQLVPVMSR